MENHESMGDQPPSPARANPGASLGRSNGNQVPHAVSGTSLRMLDCAKTFENGTRALLPFNLSVEAGETLVVLGPSGCGKTTMLRILAGLESPDAGGKVFFDEEDVTAVPIEKRNVGMVFQNYALFPNMNVAENIAYGLKVRGDSGATREKRFNEMLEMGGSARSQTSTSLSTPSTAT